MITDEIREKVFEEVSQKITHFNNPQQAAWVINANTTVAVIGRAGGKTHGFISPAVIRNVKYMPRGATGLVGPTYIKLENDLIPALVKALERFGFYEEVDFWIKQSIPKNIEHEDPFECPRNPQYSIFFKNGHILRLLGLDRKDSGNAQSNDFIIGDEAKFIKQDAFNGRIVPTNRGNEDIYFNDYHFHHGIMFCTDMPTSPESQWILNYEKDHDQDQIDLIATYAFEQQEMIIEFADQLLMSTPGLAQNIRHDKEALLATMRDLVAKGRLTEALDKRFRKELKRLDDVLFELRRECTYFIEASTLDNIDVVTERYLRQMKRVLTPAQFDTSILGLRKTGADFSFYGNFDEIKHTYTDVNYSYTENYKSTKELPQPWRKDADLDVTRGLEVGCDWGAIINCLVVGQEFRHAIKILNDFHVKAPLQVDALVKLVVEYYVGYPVKRICHYYDHTATGRDGKTGSVEYFRDLEKAFKAAGWSVENVYIGRTPAPELRYDHMNKTFGGDPTCKPVHINRINCEDLVTSVANAGTIESEKGYKKDKRPEKKPELVKPEHATHKSDALDTLVWGMTKHGRKKGNFGGDYTT